MRKKRILVTEAEADILKLIKIILENDGYEVSLADTAVEGVLKAKSEQPDLILWDAVFDVQVCKILKLQEKTKQIPIVISTVLPVTPDENSERYSGEFVADGYVLKPFSPNELLTEVKRHLS